MKLTHIFSRISNIRTISSFKIPAYRMYFLGLIGIWGSFSMNQVAQTYLMYEITGSTAMLGVITLASTAPILILSLFGGAVADRFPKKMLILVSHAGFVFIFLGYAMADITGYLGPAHPESWWVLLTGGLLMGIMIALSMPARGAIIPEIVDRERLMNAVSLNIMGMSFFQMTIPVIAGYIIGAFGYGTVYLIMAGLNVAAIIFNSFLPKIPARPVVNKNVLIDIKEGFKYILGNRTILLVVLFFIASVLLVNPLQMLMPVFAKDILRVGVEGQGTLMSLMGLGSIAVSLILASYPSKRRGLTLLISNICMGVSMVIFAFSDIWPLSMVLMVLIGVGRIGADACGNTLIQTYTDPAILGRVNSIVMVSFGLGGSGSFIIGLLAETIGSSWYLGLFSILLIIASLSAIFFLPGLRKLE
ncbi:MAG: MFS transporter [Dehalococcoidales bacterium]|nr:MAG: MFS transporter [Dehalococcoidales bacterium]